MFWKETKARGVEEMIYQPNCSETVYRIKKSELDNLTHDERLEFEEIVRDYKKPVPDYSKVRPRDDSEVCYYCYQHRGMRLRDFLFSKGIKFEGEFPFDQDMDEFEADEVK